jgi:APA family basic amino acid/polyamine antiporter
MKQYKYGFFTAVTMITGIVIGSGIFFKSDNILQYTNGNVALGVLIFIIAAFAIIFGSLTISQLARRTDKPGGLITYTDEFIGTNFSRAFGWFQMLLYMPTLSAVIPWVVGIYLCQLFGINGTNLIFTLLGLVVIIVVYGANILSSRVGGYFQNIAMIIKLIPLIIIAVFGLIFGHPIQTFSSDFDSIRHTMASTGWYAAFAPIAFSFDGWVVSTSICHEIKNSKRNLPLALIISPLLILCFYIIYFVGVTSYVGVDTVIQLGDKSAYLAANNIFGEFGGKLLLIFIIISVLGTTNGLILGFIRIPYSLAIRNMLPRSDIFARESKKFSGIPVNSALLSFSLTLIWLVIHFITQEYHIPGDVSEISIAFSYILYIALYIAVLRLLRKEQNEGFLMRYLVPILAIGGSLIIFCGSITNPMFPISILICAVILIAGFFYNRRSNE